MIRWEPAIFYKYLCIYDYRKPLSVVLWGHSERSNGNLNKVELTKSMQMITKKKVLLFFYKTNHHVFLVSRNMEINCVYMDYYPFH